MKAALPGFALLAALIVLPFVLRPPSVVDDPNAEKLVVLTPHNEAIRYEVTRAFRRHMLEKHQRRVRIDWRSPGGTSEIARYLASEYRSAFEHYYRVKFGRSLSESGLRGFADPKQSPAGESEAAQARRAFMSSDVSIKIDVLFGGGSFDFSQHAAAGRLVDSGVLTRHPELFGEHGIPETVGGELYWDKYGRWVGVVVAGFGICYNKDALARLGIQQPPKRWADLTDARLSGHIALADPSKAGSANKAFEMLLQQSMAEAVGKRGAAPGSPEERAALGEGFDAGMRLIRRIGANARYFADQAGKVTQDVQSGSAAVGMCIDFYGRMQNDAPGGADRLAFVLPEGGSSMGADPIGLLRGAPKADLARALIDFELSVEGQALWTYRRGVPGGPELYALRRSPILPLLYRPELRALSSDPEDNPYRAASAFSYHGAWTAPLFRTLSQVIRIMCVDTEVELHEAGRELERHGWPPRARAELDDVSLVSYRVIKERIAPALSSQDPLREVAVQNELVTALRAQYAKVAELARSGQ